MIRQLCVMALCALLLCPGAQASVGGAAEQPKAQPASLTLAVRVRRITLSRLRGTQRHYVVESRVLRVLAGRFKGRRFDFRVHSPSRAGLRRAGSYRLLARRSGSGYLVDEATIRPWRKARKPSK